MQPGANEIGIWFGVFALVVSVVTNIGIFVATFRSQKREVTFAGEYARKEEFDRHVERFEKETRQLNDDRKFDVREVHRRMDGVEKAVSGLESGTELLNQRIVQIDQKLDRMIERSAGPGSREGARP